MQKQDQTKKDEKGSCSAGMPKTSGSCGSEAKKTEQTGSCGSGSKDKEKGGSCG